MSTTVLQVLGPLQSRLPTILTRHFSGGVVARPLRGRRGALPKGGADSERGGRGSGERGRTTTFGDLVQSSSLLSKLGIWFLEAGTRGKQRTKLKDLPVGWGQGLVEWTVSAAYADTKTSIPSYRRRGSAQCVHGVTTWDR